MIHRILLVLILAGMAVGADIPEWRKAELRDVAFEFRLVQDVDEIERLLGDRLDEGFTFVEVRLRALYGTKVQLDRESFLLRSFRGNDRSTAQSPDRIAGSGVLALKPGGGGGNGVFSESRDGIPVGGTPGTTGPPRRLGSSIPTTVGGPVMSGPTTVETIQSAGNPEEDQSLHGRLERLELPLEAGDADVSGYLYFQIDPKHNRKNITLTYDGKYGEFRVSFAK